MLFLFFGNCCVVSICWRERVQVSCDNRRPSSAQCNIFMCLMIYEIFTWTLRSFNKLIDFLRPRFHFSFNKHTTHNQLVGDRNAALNGKGWRGTSSQSMCLIPTERRKKTTNKNALAPNRKSRATHHAEKWTHDINDMICCARVEMKCCFSFHCCLIRRERVRVIGTHIFDALKLFPDCFRSSCDLIE